MSVGVVFPQFAEVVYIDTGQWQAHAFDPDTGGYDGPTVDFTAPADLNPVQSIEDQGTLRVLAGRALR